jgi:hypothetical protein
VKATCWLLAAAALLSIVRIFVSAS